ncbi:MAG: hypothetical protein ABSA86_05175 [Oryzomonas sp.]|jgi:hypothetical protein
MGQRQFGLWSALIGSCLTREVLGKTGIKPLAQGASLWFLVSVISCAAILLGWIN